MENRILPPGQVIYREGDEGDDAYLVESGAVEISLERDGKKTVVANLQSGEIFGEMALIGDNRRGATATTLKETKLCPINREHFHHRIDRTDPVIRLFLRAINERLRLEISRPKNTKDPQVVRIHPKTARVQSELEEADQELALAKIKMEDHLSRALINNEFKLHYQPIVKIQTGEWIGLEALIRWQHPELGLIPPNVFIPLAEETALIAPIGSWVIYQALEDFSAIRLDHPSVEYVSVNISARQLTYAPFFEDLLEALHETRLTPNRLHLEITESVFAASADAKAWNQQVKDLGFKISLDDFGTGYSSLNYLEDFPVDTLKLDRSFISKATTSEKNRIITRSIIKMARELGLEVIAEGIETLEQAQAILSENCTVAQGYYFSRPMPLEQILSTEKKKAA